MIYCCSRPTATPPAPARSSARWRWCGPRCSACSTSSPACPSTSGRASSPPTSWSASRPRPRPRAKGERARVSYFVAGILRIIILEASAALLVIARVARSGDARTQRRLDLAFKLVAVIALFSWTNYGALRGGGNLVHRWEQYHFYFGSKYLPEIGYFNLYKATMLADRESARAVGYVRTTRDLTTFDEI